MAQAPYVSSVSTTLKKVYKDLQLEPLTCIVGEEESFKSAIGDSLLLAWTGKHPIGHNPSDLIKLAADPSLGIEINLQGPGVSAYWRLPIDPETGKAKKPTGPVLSGEALAHLTDEQRLAIIPSGPVRDLLKNAKGPTKLREAMLLRFGGGLSDLPEPLVLGDEERELWYDVVAKVKKTLTGEEQTVDALLAKMTEFLRKETLALTKEMSPVEAFIASRRNALQQSSAGIEMLPQKQEQLRKAKAWEDGAQLREDKKAQQQAIKELEQEIQTTLTSLESLNKENAEKRERLSQDIESQRQILVDLRKQRDEVFKKLATAEYLLETFGRYCDQNSTKCPFCRNQEANNEYNKQQFEIRTKERQQSLQTIETKLQEAEQKLADVQEELASHRVSTLQVEYVSERKISELSGDLRRTKEVLRRNEEALKDCPTSYTGPTAEDLEKDVQRLQTLTEAKTALVREGGKLRVLQQQLAKYKALEVEAKEMQLRVATSVAQRASDEVTLGMFGNRKAVLDPVSYDWSVTDPHGVPRVMGTMSGTQETSLMLGFVRAWTRGAPFRLGLFDDKDLIGMSRQGMKDFFAACEEAYAGGDLNQVVVVCPDVWLEQVPSSFEKIVCKRQHLVAVI